jgi:hypothetical protein
MALGVFGIALIVEPDDKGPSDQPLIYPFQ